MKKQILSAVLGAVMLTGAVCSAAVSQDQLNLGGIGYGATIETVTKTLGQPDKTKRETKTYGEKIKYEYGHSLEIEFLDGKVCEIEAEGISDAKTSAGIGIGSSISEVEKAYGKPDFIHKDKYIYRVTDKNLGLVFKIKNGQVKEIKCGDLN